MLQYNKEKLVLVTAAIGKTQPAEKSFTLILLFLPLRLFWLILKLC